MSEPPSALRKRIEEALDQHAREQVKHDDEDPSELHATAAHDLSRLLGITVDPKLCESYYSADESGYYIVALTLEGITFRGRFLWGGRDRRYNLAGFWQARRTRRRWLTRRQTPWVDVHDAADLRSMI